MTIRSTLMTSAAALLGATTVAHAQNLPRALADAQLAAGNRAQSYAQSQTAQKAFDASSIRVIQLPRDAVIDTADLDEKTREACTVTKSHINIGLCLFTLSVPKRSAPRLDADCVTAAMHQPRKSNADEQNQKQSQQQSQRASNSSTGGNANVGGSNTTNYNVSMIGQMRKQDVVIERLASLMVNAEFNETQVAQQRIEREFNERYARERAACEAELKEHPANQCGSSAAQTGSIGGASSSLTIRNGEPEFVDGHAQARKPGDVSVSVRYDLAQPYFYGNQGVTGHMGYANPDTVLYTVNQHNTALLGAVMVDCGTATPTVGLMRSGQEPVSGKKAATEAKRVQAAARGVCQNGMPVSDIVTNIVAKAFPQAFSAAHITPVERVAKLSTEWGPMLSDAKPTDRHMERVQTRPTNGMRQKLRPNPAKTL